MGLSNQSIRVRIEQAVIYGFTLVVAFFWKDVIEEFIEVSSTRGRVICKIYNSYSSNDSCRRYDLCHFKNRKTSR